MQQWLQDRVNALFDALLGLGVFAGVALLPVSTAARVAVLVGLLSGLYALINVKRWKVPFEARWVREPLRELRLAFLLSLPVPEKRDAPSLPALPEPRLVELSPRPPALDASPRSPLAELLADFNFPPEIEYPLDQIPQDRLAERILLFDGESPSRR